MTQGQYIEHPGTDKLQGVEIWPLPVVTHPAEDARAESDSREAAYDRYLAASFVVDSVVTYPQLRSVRWWKITGAKPDPELAAAVVPADTPYTRKRSNKAAAICAGMLKELAGIYGPANVVMLQAPNRLIAEYTVDYQELYGDDRDTQAIMFRPWHDQAIPPLSLIDNTFSPPAPPEWSRPS